MRPRGGEPPPLLRSGGGGRIRTYVDVTSADLQSAAFNHSATPPHRRRPLPPGANAAYIVIGAGVSTFLARRCPRPAAADRFGDGLPPIRRRRTRGRARRRLLALGRAPAARRARQSAAPHPPRARHAAGARPSARARTPASPRRRRSVAADHRRGPSRRRRAPGLRCPRGAARGALPRRRPERRRRGAGRRPRPRLGPAECRRGAALGGGVRRGRRHRGPPRRAARERRPRQSRGGGSRHCAAAAGRATSRAPCGALPTPAGGSSPSTTPRALRSMRRGCRGAPLSCSAPRARGCGGSRAKPATNASPCRCRARSIVSTYPMLAPLRSMRRRKRRPTRRRSSTGRATVL